MKSHWLGWVGMTLSLCGLVACGKGHVIVAKQLGIPTFEELPVITNQAQLPVHGKRTANVEVWAKQAASDARLAPAADNIAWTGTLALQQGLNTVFLYAKDGSNAGEKSTGYTVFLDTTPPSPPTVYAPDAVNVGAGGSITTTISGTKDPDSSIVVNGNTLVPNDGLTAWTTTITVNLGDNTYNITAVDAAGNVSTPVVVSIFGSTLSTPVILVPSGYANMVPNFNPNDQPFLTNNPNAEFIGSKQGDTDLYFYFNGGAGQDVSFINSTSWDYPFQLGADGTYIVGFQVKKNGTEQRSGTARVKIMLKTTKPLKPVVSSPSFPVADTGDSSITVKGSLPSADSQLCVSNTSDGPCIATSSGGYNGGSFTVSVPLGDANSNLTNTGDNPLYISARDAYGNISDEIQTSVYRISSPVVSITQPATNGGVGTITGNSLPVSVTVTANPGDNLNAHPAAAIHSVQVCFDTTCVNATATGNGVYTVPDFDLTGLINGSVHHLQVTASNSLSPPLESNPTVSLIYSDGSPIWVSNGDPNQIAQTPRTAFDSAGTLHAVWTDFCGADPNCTVANANQALAPDIFYAKRDRTTGVWSNPVLISVLLSGGDGVSREPSIAVDNADNVHIAWADNGTVGGRPTGWSGFAVVHRVLSHTGTLSSPVLVGSPVSGVNDGKPSLAVDPTGTVHLAYTRVPASGTQSYIYYARFVNNAWTSALLVTDDPATGTAEAPSIAGVPGGTAHVAWQECRGAACTAANPNRDIYLRTITSATQVGPAALLVSDGAFDGDSLQPSLVVDASGKDWVFWRDSAYSGSQNNAGPHPAPSNIWLQLYNNGAKVSGSLSMVSDDSSTKSASTPDQGFAAEQPMAAIGPVVSGDQTIAVVWTQINPGNSTADIASKYGKVSHGVTDLVTTNPMRYVVQDSGTSMEACVALDSTDASDLYVVWGDDTTFGLANPGGVEQIFFQIQTP